MLLRFHLYAKSAPPRLPDPLLTVANLSVERGGRLVLFRLSFTLAGGDILLVSGRNGSGKSTLLRTIAGLLQPTAGRIDFALATKEVRGVETVHYLGYDDALKPSLTVRENLQFWAAMLSSPAARQGSGSVHGMVASNLAPRDALAAFGIARLIDLPAGYLSAGQKRRVALARLLLAYRPIWLLDEPLIALDAETQETTAAVMAAHGAAGGAILLASHQPLTLEARQINLDALAANQGSASADIAAEWQAGLA